VANAAALAGANVALIDRVAAPDGSKLPASLRSALLLGNVDLAAAGGASAGAGCGG